MSSQSSVLQPDEYALLVEQAPIMIWRSGTDALCDYFNERWLAFTGRTMAQELGNGWTKGVHPEDFKHCLDIYLAAFQRQETFEMEYRLKRHDGVYRWIFDRGVPVYDVHHRFLGYIGSCIDVTERVEAREAMKRLQEAQLKVLHGLLPICMTCKKIRNDKGDWERLEDYIHGHSDADFSHGYCPECAKAYYEEEIKPLKELDGPIAPPKPA